MIIGLLSVILILAAGTPTALAGPDRCSGQRPGQPANKCTASLLYFNDAHDVRPVVDDGVSRGGVARLSTVIDDARRQNRNSAVAFGGDLAGGTLFGGIYHGFPMVEALNRIGVDIANFGQHDFDFGTENARALMAASDFGWVSSNLVDRSGAPFSGRPWHVQRVGTFDIGYLGLTDQMDTTGASADVDQQPVVDSAQRALAEMTAAEHPDVVVALTQQGPQENADLVAAVPGIDLVLTEEIEEDQSVLTRTDSGVWIAAPEGNIGSVIKIDIRRHGHRTVIEPDVLEVDDTVRPDPELQRFEDHYAADLEERLGEKIAEVQTPMLMTDNAHRKGEVTLGNLVADAFRSGTSFADELPADIGWIQGGGLRAEVPGPDFTLASGYSVLPFSNKVIKVEATGAQIRAGLEQGVAGYEDLGGALPHVSGMSYAFDPGRPVGSRVQSVQVGDQELTDDGTYTLALPNYVQQGGDGVTAFVDATVLVDPATATVDAEALINYVRDLGTIDYALEGRITVEP